MMKIPIAGKRLAAGAAVVAAMSLMAACGGRYYEVTDAGSGKSYYTRDIEHKHGHVQFKDKASGDEVSLDSSEIREITPQQYDNAVRRK